jgi:hypothetical protein
MHRPRIAHRVLLTAAAALFAACTPPTSGPPSLTAVKRKVFGQQAQIEADRIGAGVQQPILDFLVEATPPSIFVNWVIPDAQAAAFSSFVDLPPGFTLAKVRIVESDPAPAYWLSLNVYRVSGITTGLRAEWSTYVDDGSGSPRFMIVRARAADGSLDPLGPLAFPEPFAHSLSGDVITTTMNKTVLQNGIPVLTGDPLYASTIDLPDPADRTFVTPTREWVAANDFIYWLNGVNDRIFHNSTSHSAPLISVDLDDVTIADDSEFVPYLDPTPAHVLVYLDRIEFMIGPWWNVTFPDGRVDPGTVASLFAYKKTVYGGLFGLRALSVLTGAEQPIVATTAPSSTPPTSWHWRIPPAQLAAFAAAAEVPAGFTLAPVRLAEDDPTPDYWLTLQVTGETSTFTSGLRAEWSTYVTDGTGIRTLILSGVADFPWLDPTNVPSTDAPYTPAGAVSHSLAGSTLTSSIGSGQASFTSTFTVPPAGPTTTQVPTREWGGSRDLRVWRNSVVDRIFYDTSLFEPVISVNPATATTSPAGTWAPYVGTSPDRIWVAQRGTDQVLNPWFNR